MSLLFDLLIRVPKPLFEPKAGSRECLRCHQVKDFSEFSPRSDGKGGVRPLCRPCYNKHQSEAYHKRKKANAQQVMAQR